MFYSSVSNPNNTVIYVVVVMRMNHEVRLLNVQRKSVLSSTFRIKDVPASFTKGAFTKGAKNSMNLCLTSSLYQSSAAVKSQKTEELCKL